MNDNKNRVNVNLKSEMYNHDNEKIIRREDYNYKKTNKYWPIYLLSIIFLILILIYIIILVK